MGLPTDKVRTKLELQGDRKMRSDLKRTEGAFKGFSGGVQGALGGLASLGPAAGAAAAGLGILVAEIQLWGRAIEFAARQTWELVRRSGDVGDIAGAFERLTDPGMIERLRAVTGGIADNTMLMQNFNRAARAGILTNEELVTSFDLVTRAARDTNRPLERMLRQFTVAAAGGGIEFLAQLGVNVDAVNEKIRAAGLSMDTTEGQGEALRVGLDMLAESLEDSDNAAGAAGDAQAQLETALQNVYDAASLAFGENEQLIESLTQLAEVVQATIPHVARMAGVFGRSLVIAIQGTISTVRTFVNIMATLPGEAGDAYRSIQTIIAAFEAQTTAARKASEAARVAARAGGSMSGGGSGRRQRRERRGGGGGRAAEPSLEDLMAGAVGSGDVLEEVYAGAESRAVEAARAAQEAEAALHAARMQAGQERKDFELDLQRIQRETFEQMSEAYDRDLAQHRARSAARREEILGVADAGAQAFQIFGGIMQQVIAQQEAAGQGAEILKKIHGSFLIAYNVVMAATETAKAIGAGASQNWPEMAAHIASAAAHTAAAVMAGVELGGGAAAGSAASATPVAPTFTPAEAPLGPPSGDTGSVTIQNKYLMSDSEASLARSLERAKWRRSRQQRVRRSDAVRYGP